jgi:hypothetical protein
MENFVVATTQFVNSSCEYIFGIGHVFTVCRLDNGDYVKIDGMYSCDDEVLD